MRASAIVGQWRTAVVAAAFSALAAVYYTWTWSYELGDFGGDNAFYLLTAQYFSPWSGPDAVAAYFASQSQYPPLYPLVLALFGGGESLLVAHLITTTALLLAFAVFYLWLRKLGFTELAATAIVVLFALLPGTLTQALSILSENLYLLGTLVCLAAVEIHEVDRSPGWLWIAAAGLAGALLTRSAGIALLAAFILYLLLHRPARFWIPAFVVAVPFALWQFLSRQTGPGYLRAFADKYAMQAPDGLIGHLTGEAGAVWYGWIVDFTSSPIGVPVMGVVGILCLAGAVYRAYRCKLDGLYVVAYLSLILIWPYPAEAARFVLVVIPIMLVQGCLLADLLPRRMFGRITLRPSWIALFAVAMIVAPGLLLMAKRFTQPLPDELAGFKRTSVWYLLEPRQALASIVDEKLLTDHLRKIRKFVPEHDCVYSIKPSIVGYYGRRISMIPPRLHFDDTTFAFYLDQNGCRFFYLLGFASPSFPTVYYPLERMRDSLKIISTAQRPGGDDLPVGVLAQRIVR